MNYIKLKTFGFSSTRGDREKEYKLHQRPKKT